MSFRYLPNGLKLVFLHITGVKIPYSENKLLIAGSPKTKKNKGSV